MAKERITIQNGLGKGKEGRRRVIEGKIAELEKQRGDYDETTYQKSLEYYKEALKKNEEVSSYSELDVCFQDAAVRHLMLTISFQEYVALMGKSLQDYVPQTLRGGLRAHFKGDLGDLIGGILEVKIDLLDRARNLGAEIVVSSKTSFIPFRKLAVGYEYYIYVEGCALFSSRARKYQLTSNPNFLESY